MLVLANGAFAGGAYQATEDRKKALVWNNDPKPEDAATWSGNRDADGYATGPGTLKWYQISRAFTTGSNLATARKKTEISSYSGTMVRGKFNGHVVTVDHGKTYYATFADGRRKGHWMAGPLIVKAEGVEAASEKPERSQSAKSTETQPPAGKVSQEKAEARVEAEPDVPAAGPAEETEVSESATTKPSEPLTKASPTPVQSQSGSDLAPRTNTQPASPLIAQASTEEPGESATPREPVTKKAALAPGAVRAIERPTNAAAKKSEPPRVKSEKGENVAKTAKSTPSQPAKLDTNLKEDLPSEGPDSAAAESSQAPKPKSQNSSSSQPASKETPADDSIRELTGPPSSLRSNPPPETNPPTQIPTPATVAASPPPPASPKLTAVNAMDIADIEARTKGYDLGEYQLPKAEYNSATDTWSVAYIPRDADSTAKKLNVSIQDKSGKAEVRK
jgi:hypothetical protein